MEKITWAQDTGPRMPDDIFDLGNAVVEEFHSADIFVLLEDQSFALQWPSLKTIVLYLKKN
jgi:hypothetical protein